uniref:Putative secreted protein n=1 Tax=Ixodes ricinus TaxID=34613 RepID=V5IFD9_IXORI
MIVANFAFFIICLQTTPRGARSQEIKIQFGLAHTIGEKCKDKFREQCLKSPDSEKGLLKRIDLDFPFCRLTCNYEVSPGNWHGTGMWLPDHLPCEYGRVCKDGKCIQDVC